MFSSNVVRKISNIWESKTVSQVVLPSLILSTILSLSLYSYNKNTLVDNYNRQFQRDSAQLVAHIDNEINRYEELLFSTNAFISSLENFDQSVLKKYIYQLDLNNFPAFYAINYFEPVEHKDIDVFYDSLYKKYTYEDKHLKPLIGKNIWENHQRTKKTDTTHYIVSYFEPANRGVKYIGRAADADAKLIESLEKGKQSHKIFQTPNYLVGQTGQDENSWIAFLRLSSFDSPHDVRTYKGSIGLGIRLNNSLFGKVRNNLKYIHFQVIDDSNNSGKILYDSRYSRKSVHAVWPASLEKSKQQANFLTTMPAKLLKKNVRIVLFTNENPPNIGSIGIMQIISLGTFLITFLLFFFMFNRWFVLNKDKNKAQDIAEKITEELRTMAYTDTLTQLPNRHSFVENLNAFIENHPNEQAYLFFMDLDGFKKINDTLGHKTGDLVLQEFSNRLRKLSIKEPIQCYRIGGDEFTIFIEDPTKKYTNEYIKEIAQQVLELAHESFIVEGEKFKLSSSIGIAQFPLDGTTTEDLFQNSDLAMYHIKHQGKNNFSFYSEVVGKQIKEQKQIETLLSTALENNEFYLVFQPKTVQIGDTYKPIGAEVLLRWKNEKLGEVSPDQFIPVAEETGIMNEIGHWVFEESIKKLAQWNKAGVNDINLSINLSVIQFSNPELVKDCISVLKKYNVSSKQIILEITESVVTNDIKAFKKMLKQFSNYGFKISMDDFGTGYSSLYFLRRLEINEIKIDRTFTQNILVNQTDCVVLDALINLAQKLDLNIVIEGVEDKEQLDWFKDRGNLQMQGFYFSKPVREEQFLKYWRDNQSKEKATSNC